MTTKISVVINTINEEQNIEKAIQSVDWVNEIVVCDMQSTDNTVKIAKKLGARVFTTKRMEYVEPARNLAISKATSEWILVLDPDEEIQESLAKKLQEIAESMEQVDYVRLPRKNLIFNRFMRASMWWPDYNIRFFKKGKVKWGDKIHRPPEIIGQGLDLPADEKYAIIHHNYGSVSDFIKRMDRYTSVQAAELIKEGYQFNWKDLLQKPLSEFLSRFFANYGYQDGLHGLVLSLLQAFSFLVVYLKVWEKSKFKEQEITFSEFRNEAQVNGKAIEYWFKSENKNLFKKIYKIFN